MTPEEQSKNKKVAEKKKRNKTADGTKVPVMVNKTLRKDIFDPIIMRRDFNNVEIIGDQKSTKGV